MRQKKNLKQIVDFALIKKNVKLENKTLKKGEMFDIKKKMISDIWKSERVEGK